MRHSLSLVAVVTLTLLMTAGVTRAADSKKPNILIIWGDDIGYWNLSAYNQGMMGYKTPNIDRIAKEGALFTDWYGQQSCTAGRSCFITGQSGFRTGMLKVGLPGAKEGLQARDVTIAELLKFGTDELKLDYIFWCTQEPYYSNELIPFMRTARRG
jgi:arylsulfatase